MTDPDNETDELLFREAAIKSLTWRDQGKVIAYLPPAWWWLCSFLLAAVIVVAVFISIGTYARKESVYGILRNSAGEMRVRPTQTGIIDAILVQPGQQVRKGQPLA